MTVFSRLLRRQQLLLLEKELEILTLLLYRRRRKRRHRWWLHPINQRRKSQGAYHNLVNELLQDEPTLLAIQFGLLRAFLMPLLTKLEPRKRRMEIETWDSNWWSDVIPCGPCEHAEKNRYMTELRKRTHPQAPASVPSPAPAPASMETRLYRAWWLKKDFKPLLRRKPSFPLHVCERRLLFTYATTAKDYGYLECMKNKKHVKNKIIIIEIKDTTKVIQSIWSYLLFSLMMVFSRVVSFFIHFTFLDHFRLSSI